MPLLDKSFINVLLLGLAFLLIFTSFQTGGMIQKTVVDSVNHEYANKWSTKWDGFTSFFIIYGVFALFNWIAPSVVNILGPKFSMIISALTYCLFVSNFLYPLSFGLNVASAIIGAGAAVIWTAQGNFLTLNSDLTTIARNSGIFWAMLQCSLLFGNLFVYFEFQGKSNIDDKTRLVTYTVLTITCLIGTSVLFLLRNVRDTNEATQISPLQQIKKSVNLMMTEKMLLLCVTFVYTGLELAFFSAVYGASIGYTLKIAADPKKFIGISGILIGLGEIIGGATFGLLGSKTTKHGRDPIILLGFFVHIVAFIIIFLNQPPNASFSDTTDIGFINPSLTLALICSFLLGLGDSCFNTQIYSILGSVYKDDSGPAFALFKFFQSIAAAIAFIYTSHVNLHIQLIILAVFDVIGSITFCLVERLVKKEAIEKETEAKKNDYPTNFVAGDLGENAGGR